MNLVFQVPRDLLGRWENRRGLQRLRFKEETRAIQALRVLLGIKDIQGLLVLQVDREEKRENQENQENEANQEKTVIQVLQDSLEVKDNQAFPVHRAEMEREDTKVNEDSQALREW